MLAEHPEHKRPHFGRQEQHVRQHRLRECLRPQRQLPVWCLGEFRLQKLFGILLPEHHAAWPGDVRVLSQLRVDGVELMIDLLHR